MNIKKCLIFLSVIFLCIAFLILPTVFTKKIYVNKLKTNVETVLEKSRPIDFNTKFTVGENIKINSPLSYSTCVYKINSPSYSVKYVLITRVTNFYGPQCAIFTFDEKQGTLFEGFTNIPSRIENQIYTKNNDLIIKHWTKKANDLFMSIENN